MDKIKYNCDLINENLLSKSADLILIHEDITSSFVAGRYVCFLSLSISAGKFDLMFFDFKNSDKSFQNFLHYYKDVVSNYAEKLKYSFDYLKSEYDKNYNEFLLKIGDHPPF